jgi:hypothetical protein
MNFRRALSIGLMFAALAFNVPIASYAGAEGEKAAAQESRSSQVYKEVTEVVKDFYPKAKVTQNGDKIHFEYKVRSHIGSYSNRQELSPDLGGILGDIEVKSGEYKGREKLPTELNEYVHVVLLMAPYSKSANNHLLTRVAYPPDTPIDFLDRIKAVVNQYNAGESAIAATAPSAPAVAAPAASSAAPAAAPAQPAASSSAASSSATSETAALPAATTSAAASPPSATPAKAAALDSKVSFGAAKLSKYSYPEGRFRILLPGAPQMKYQDMAGVRMVDYEYPEVQGCYNISYVIFPGFANPAMLQSFFDKLTANLVGQMKGSQVKQINADMYGYPGRQVEVGVLKDKPGQIARWKMLVVRRYVYVVGASGNKAWVDSPIVAQVLGSFEATPEPTQAELAQEQRRKFERDAQARKADFDRKFKESQDHFNQARMNNQKDFERSRTQFENDRWRH